jgi:hypothetical protein
MFEQAVVKIDFCARVLRPGATSPYMISTKPKIVRIRHLLDGRT